LATSIIAQAGLVFPALLPVNMPAYQYVSDKMAMLTKLQPYVPFFIANGHSRR
jgi:hypothetical protein